MAFVGWLLARQRIILLALGIYACHLSLGYFLEDLHNRSFAGGSRWSFPEGLLIFTLLGNLAVASFMLFTRPSPLSRGPLVPLHLYLLVALPSVAATGFTYFAMSRVDYPTISLFKSTKPVAVLAVALLFCQTHVYSAKHKMMVVFVTLGLMGFFFSKEGGSVATTAAVHPFATRIVGYLGLLGASLGDGLSALAVSHALRQPSPPSAYHLQFYVNIFALLAVFSYASTFGRLVEIIQFLSLNREVWLILFKVSVLNGVGQLFVFMTIANFDPLVLSIVTTSRKVFTIVLSAIIYNHSLKPLQWFSVGVVFTGLLWRDLLELAKLYYKGPTIQRVTATPDASSIV